MWNFRIGWKDRERPCQRDSFAVTITEVKLMTGVTVAVVAATGERKSLGLSR